LSDQRVVVIGASAGGLDAMRQIVRKLPHDFDAPILVVMHIPSQNESLLAQILARETMLPAKQVVDGERARNGVIYVAAPDKHLMIEEDGTLRSVHGPRENRHRPAVDPLLRSAALAYGGRAVGVILSGALDDGTAGLLEIKRRGGMAVVQDPREAPHAGMPESALAHVDVDYVLPASEIAEQLVALTAERRRDVEVDDVLEREVMASAGEIVKDDERPGRPSVFSCPDCGGVLWQLDDKELMHYRCRVGHAFSPDSLAEAQDDQIERALWMALKTLEESAQLAHRLASSERTRGHEWMAERFAEKERDARERADVIRRFLTPESEAESRPREKVSQRGG